MIFDTKWFNALIGLQRPVDEFGLYGSSLKIDVKGQSRFFENDIENPRFLYRTKNTELFDTIKYQALLEKIQNEESNKIIRKLYVTKIKHQLLRLEMLNASLLVDDALFYEKSVKLYGKPKKVYFAYIAKRIKQQAKQAESKEQKKAAKNLLKVFSKIDTSRCTIDPDILPPPVPDTGKVIKAVEVKAIFEETLKRYEIDDWDVVIDPECERSIFAASQRTKIVHIPCDTQLKSRSKKFTALQAEALAEHEIGVHVRRSHNGQHSALKLLSIGLPGYIRGEEGIATFVQQQIEGATEFYGFQRYLAACLAVGMDGEKRDFRAVYQLLYDYYILTSKPNFKDIKRAQQFAWSTCMRIFRGTSAKKNGYIFTKDILYLEGNIEIWNEIIKKPDILSSYFVGKYNPLMKEHVTALKELGILTD